MIEHPNDKQLQSYVMDSLDPITAEGLERHVFDCESCATRLAVQARVELALAEVATSPAEEASKPVIRSFRYASLVLFAATVLLAVGLRNAVHEAAPEPSWTLQSSDCEDLSTCVLNTQQAPMAIDPSTAMAPIYERLPPGMNAGRI